MEPSNLKQEANIDHLKIAYEEICRSHDGIADFRAKLLALLPIASGTGLFALLFSDDGTYDQVNLTVIGLVGALLTWGLFLYELRGIQRCNAMSSYGCALEEEFLGPYRNHGAFSGEPKAIGFVGNTWAACVIYPTLIAAWTYVSLIGLPFSPAYHWLAVILALIVGISVVAFARRIDTRQGEELVKLHRGCRHSMGAAYGHKRIRESELTKAR